MPTRSASVLPQFALTRLDPATLAPVRSTIIRIASARACVVVLHADSSSANAVRSSMPHSQPGESPALSSVLPNPSQPTLVLTIIGSCQVESMQSSPIRSAQSCPAAILPARVRARDASPSGAVRLGAGGRHAAPVPAGSIGHRRVIVRKILPLGSCCGCLTCVVAPTIP